MLFDAVPGVFDDAYGLFDDGAVKNDQIVISGVSATSSVGQVVAEVSKSSLVSGVSATISLGNIVATGNQPAQAVSTGGSRKRRGRKGYWLDLAPYVPIDEPKKVVEKKAEIVISHCKVSLAPASLYTSCGQLFASGQIIIPAKAFVASLQIESQTFNLQGSGIINPSDEELIYLLAA